MRKSTQFLTFLNLVFLKIFFVFRIAKVINCRLLTLKPLLKVQQSNLFALWITFLYQRRYPSPLSRADGRPWTEGCSHGRPWSTLAKWNCWVQVLPHFPKAGALQKQSLNNMHSLESTRSWWRRQCNTLATEPPASPSSQAPPPVSTMWQLRQVSRF